jgi:Asp-tRNA(Asn)/Glu-tRNA(Gln) amidotransferase C subunit
MDHISTSNSPTSSSKKITEETVAYVARLARLYYTKEEQQQMALDLSSIIECATR